MKLRCAARHQTPETDNVRPVHDGFRPDPHHANLGLGDVMPETLESLARRPTAKQAKESMLEALVVMAKKPCHRIDCGTACLCGSCHAKRALRYYKPTWRPR